MTERLEGRTAIVTGAGSGIGAALCRALDRAGATVVCADLDLRAAERTAAGLGRAVARRVDVTDAGAVAACVDEVVDTHGALDLMFNNAGITFGGPTESLTLAQWDALIDVNVRGVVHGVHAAYPVMVRQRRGTIVNTASMGGLVAAGLITGYVTTKHAVVGLSLALRTEAAAHGVNVLAVCPAAVETPILDQGHLGGFDGRRYYLSGQGLTRAHDPDVLAQEALRAIERRQALLVTPRRARIAYRADRYAPWLSRRMATRFVDRMRP